VDSYSVDHCRCVTVSHAPEPTPVNSLASQLTELIVASRENEEYACSHAWCIAPSSSCVLPLLLPNNALRDPEEHGGGWQ